MKYFLIPFLVFFFGTISLHAQLPEDIFPLNRNYYSNGFYFTPSLNYNLSWDKTSESYSNQDSVYSYQSSAEGDLGFGIEIGLFQSFEKPIFFHYIEGGLAFRQYSGSANHTGQLFISDTLRNSYQSENTFTHQHLIATFRAARADQIGKYTFLHSAIGVQANYLFSNQAKRESDYPYSFEEFPKDITAKAHLQFGLGIRLTELVLFVPSVEIPFLNLYPFDGFESRFQAFSNLHQPIIFNLKFMFLRKNLMNCNAPTYNGIPQ